eukprot:527493-Hanusia_phi.AAC.1
MKWRRRRRRRRRRGRRRRGTGAGSEGGERVGERQGGGSQEPVVLGDHVFKNSLLFDQVLTLALSLDLDLR